jgi:hypothetical protein
MPFSGVFVPHVPVITNQDSAPVASVEVLLALLEKQVLTTPPRSLSIKKLAAQKEQRSRYQPGKL